MESIRGIAVRKIFVRMKGLEPPRPKALDPKSSASTNSATSADFRSCKNTTFFKI